MTTLDRIMEMQKNGVTDVEITTQLTNEGIPPADINNSLNQAKIKNAVSPPDVPTSQSGMQASIMGGDANINQSQGSQGLPPQEGVPQQTNTQQSQMPIPPPPQVPQDPANTKGPEIYPAEAPIDPYYAETPQAYPDQDYYAPAEALSTDTISEIAEQVATEKINEYKEKTGDILNFKNRIQEKVNDIDDRLKRIESSIDSLQHAIIGKVGELGESSAMIHKDLDNLHGTVQKLMNPLVDNINALKKLAK
ncbi:MAG: hypothetical protein IH845_02535 [Nanoarchaeota archaeon]|nr:hypothetical protein [Nanoarchaeota archaeon]